jgi:predicted LPLAT superfamily acyltransferase
MTVTPVPASPRIRARKRGNRLGIWFFRTALRLHGLRGPYALLYLVAGYYWLFDRAARRAALPYLRRRFPAHGRLRLWRDLYRLFVSQGRHLIDRFCLRTGYGQWDLRIPELDRLKPLLESGRGFVLLTAHMGNWQAVMDCLRGFNKPVNLLMRPEDNPAVSEALQVTENRDRLRVISSEGFLGGVVEITSRLQQGEIVAVMGDRVYDFNSVSVRFLGDEARFPCGGLHLAAATGSPVVVLLSAKMAAWRYDVLVADVFTPAYQRGRPKSDQLREWVQRFADDLGAYVEKHPYQCFLFHDVWREARGTPAKPAGRPQGRVTMNPARGSGG